MSYGIEEVGAPHSSYITALLRGLSGIELGFAPHNDYRLNTWARVAADDDPIYGANNDERWVTHRVKRHTWRLPFEDSSADFVFSSHVLEHIYNPFAAVAEHLRVARRYVVYVLPHRDRTGDSDRPLSDWEELMGRSDADAASAPEPPAGHYNVWDTSSFLGHMAQLGHKVVGVLCPDDKLGNGFIAVLGKGSP